jgi:hypothetical protein
MRVFVAEALAMLPNIISGFPTIVAEEIKLPPVMLPVALTNVNALAPNPLPIRLPDKLPDKLIPDIPVNCDPLPIK